MRVAFYLLTGLAAAGAWVSELLIQKHIGYLYAGAGDSGICAGTYFSCEEAAQSAMAEIAGLPIAALGLAFYVMVLLLGLAWRFFSESLPRSPDVLLLSGALAVLYSVVLGVYTLVALDHVCPLCLTLYGINFGLLLTAWLWHPGRGGEGVRPIRGLPRARAAWLALGLMAVFTVGAQARYAHGARAAVAARKAPPEEADVEVGVAPARGEADAPVVVVEFSDFQCPYCRRLADNLKAAAKEAPGLFRYHFKHYPMDKTCNRKITQDFHQNACRAAVAVECARREGRFWEMHDILFENQQKLGAEDLRGYARKIGLDLDRWQACADSEDALEAVRRDVEQGIALQVRGTPTFFVNRTRLVGGLPPDKIIAAVEKAKAAAASK